MQDENFRPSGKARQQVRFDRRLDRGSLTPAQHARQVDRLHQTGAGAKARRVLKNQITLANKWLQRGRLTVAEHAARVAELHSKLGEEWTPGAERIPSPATTAPTKPSTGGDWPRNPRPAHAARLRQVAERRASLRPPAGFDTVPAFFEAIRALLLRLPSPNGGNIAKEASVSGAARACGVTGRSVHRWLALANPRFPEQPRLNLLARWYRRVLRQNPA